MAKTANNVPFTLDETKQAQSCIKGLCDVATKGAEKWSALRALAMNGHEVDKGRKAQLAEWYRAEWIARAKAKAGEAWTVESVADAKKVANADFSRGMRDPDAVPVKRAPQSPVVPLIGPQGDATVPIGDRVAEMQQIAATGDFQRKHLAEQLLVRGKSLNAAMLQFQTAKGVRMPASVKEIVGDMAEQINKLNEECNALLALYA